MKQSSNNCKTDSTIPITGEELHELDWVCARLVNATESARRADDELAPNVPDVKAHPVPALQSLSAGQIELGLLLDSLRASLRAAWRDGTGWLRERLISHWLHLVYSGAVPLLQKKFQLARALGNQSAATKFADAFDTIPPCKKIDHLNGWKDIEGEAKQLAGTIAPDGFYFDIRKAFMLDAEATEELNSANAPQTPVRAVLVGEQAGQLANASARKVKELTGKSAGGRRGAALAKADHGEDTKRKAILDEAKKKLKEWNERYSNRHEPPRDVGHSNRAAFRIVANRHLKADGKPIMSSGAIERALNRKKNEKRGKHPRTGKKRGKYKPRT